MKPNQIIAIALLLGAAVLAYFGYQSTQSVTEQIHESLTGRFTDATMWYFVFAAVCAVAGLVMLRR
jgi:threonine/homoserine/homoserine lactone efflux protein